MELDDIPTPTQPEHILTGRQRVAVGICRTLASDFDIHATTDEAHTASLLRLVAEAVTLGCAGELAEVWRGMMLHREAGA